MDADDRRPFEEWGILAAPRFLGRANLVLALNRFRAEEVWGVSPHLIPHFALHSQAGTLSLVLGTHGPNIGLGGGIHAATEGLLTALSWLQAGVVPGVWLVATSWSPEYRPDPEGRPVDSAECLGMALAMVPTGTDVSGSARIQLVPTGVAEAPSPLDPVGLSRRLDRDTPSASTRRVSPSRRVMLHEGHAGSILPRPHLDRNRQPHPSTWVAAVDATGKRRFEVVCL
jgi:hypothetical protein